VGRWEAGERAGGRAGRRASGRPVERDLRDTNERTERNGTNYLPQCQDNLSITILDVHESLIVNSNLPAVGGDTRATTQWYKIPTNMALCPVTRGHVARLLIRPAWLCVCFKTTEAFKSVAIQSSVGPWGSVSKAVMGGLF
jgi:hypothetical protein